MLYLLSASFGTILECYLNVVNTNQNATFSGNLRTRERCLCPCIQNSAGAPLAAGATMQTFFSPPNCISVFNTNYFTRAELCHFWPPLRPHTKQLWFLPAGAWSVCRTCDETSRMASASCGASFARRISRFGRETQEWRLTSCETAWWSAG